MLRLVVMMGAVSKIRVVSVREENRFITFIWSRTNFLVPKTNGITTIQFENAMLLYGVA